MSQNNWVKVLQNTYELGVQLQTTPKKGNIVYEYNPFRNYRLDKDMYEYQGYLYTLDELKSKEIFIYYYYENNGEKYTLDQIEKENDKYYLITETGKTELYGEVKKIEEWNVTDTPILREKGELVDFVTDQLQFSLQHPVNILPQYSYDGSVNLILNDGVNTPKLINSRFSATGKNTYEIVDRTGNNDTNIYDQGSEFELDTSLYKRVLSIPKIVYNGTYSGGNLKVGNYFFYFKLSDADSNETDFIGESGLVSIFVGSTPRNIHTGQKNENSNKNISFTISNIDTSYDYLVVYYSRATAEGSLNSEIEYCKINKKFAVNNSGNCNLVITGFEEVINVSASEINANYNIVDSAKAQATCQNMLFLGNVHKPEIPHVELQDLSLHFLPYLKETQYECDITYEYDINSPSLGYYDSKFIYDKTGYWGNELYRFGVVYILNNGELSPVFNTRGGVIDTSPEFTGTSVYSNGKRTYISYDEETFKVYDSKMLNENVKGVVKLIPDNDTDTIYGISFKISKEALDELKKYVRGFFFVRQTRIPTILAQGITVGIDKISRIPCIPTAHGVLETIPSQLQNTHVTTNDIYDVNYISEGFLSRYSFDFKKKKSGLWSKVATVGMIALAAGLTLTGAFIAVAAVAGALGIAASTAAVAAVKIGVTFGIVGSGVTAVRAGLQDWSLSRKRKGQSLKFDGRNTPIPPGYELVEIDKSRKLTQNFNDRLIIKDPSTVDIQGILCPDYEINQAYYNSIFTGNQHKIDLAKSQSVNMLDDTCSYNYFNNDYRHFYLSDYFDNHSDRTYVSKIIGVPDSIKAVGLSDKIYRSRAGYKEEAWKFETVGLKFDDELDESDVLQIASKEKIKNTDIIRGEFGPYLAVDTEGLRPAEIVNIYTPGFEKLTLDSLFEIRQNDSSPFYAISDRMSIADIEIQNKPILITDSIDEYNFTCYRGDCYICQFTHRLNRNFNDPSAPYNDEIVDVNTWKNNYTPDNVVNYSKINLGDVNAVQLGMWITFKVRSSNNLNIRTLDGSYVDEVAMTGHPRAFYPHNNMIVEGTYKHADSQVYNKGFQKSVGDKWNHVIPDVPHLKNWFGTRIMYSDIHINDSFKNGYRVFQGTNYRDYTREYGEIIKLISLGSDLLCVFEHGIALIPVNERAVAASGSGGNVYINTSNVLPENPKIISDTYGSHFADSIIKTPNFVYGVDTVAKKIWRTDGNSLQLISDLKVQEFLNNNITLSEREITPIMGIRNVKTFYNAFKQDIMFTYYDNLEGFEEKAWNLCYNESLGMFITFYSWIPSMMENIDNIPFSFDRNTTKQIAKLGISKSNNSFSNGITLSNNVISEYTDTSSKQEVGTLNFDLFEYNKITYELVEDIYKNKNNFIIDGDTLYINEGVDYEKLCSELYERNEDGSIKTDASGKPLYLSYSNQKNPDKVVLYLNVRATLKKDDINLGTYDSTIAVITQYNKQFLNTNFWKHGQAGNFDITEEIYPTFWYGKQHPFEFEVIVVNDPATHKIFTNLELIANKAKPESFHYEIIGECFDFHKDKPNMYYRQEGRKHIWQLNGVDISYDHKYTTINTQWQSKSSDLIHKYYARKDTINEIENYYISKNSKGYDYRHLAGAEIVYYKNRQEYRICNHVRAISLEDNIIAANCRYLEDRWRTTINPILICYKNEEKWENKPPIPILNSIPDEIAERGIMNNLKGFDYDSTDWLGELDCNRKEIDLRDRFIKIKVRYSGEELAVIDFLNTIYRISYA